MWRSWRSQCKKNANKNGNKNITIYDEWKTYIIESNTDSIIKIL